MISIDFVCPVARSPTIHVVPSYVPLPTVVNDATCVGIVSSNVSPVRDVLPLLFVVSVNVIVSPALGNVLSTLLSRPTSGELTSM